MLRFYCSIVESYGILHYKEVRLNNITQAEIVHTKLVYSNILFFSYVVPNTCNNWTEKLGTHCMYYLNYELMCFTRPQMGSSFCCDLCA